MNRRQDGGRVPEPKTCVSCGRQITWRRAWARDWDEVRYCSAGCRRRGLTETDRALEAALRTRLAASGRTGVDPEDVAAQVWSTDEDLREPSRRAARRLVAAGEAEMVQRGRVVDPSTARGPVRLRRT